LVPMARLTEGEATLLGVLLDSLFYGMYCVVFVLYLHVQKRGPKNRLIYPLSILFFLTTIYYILGSNEQFSIIFNPGGRRSPVSYNLNLATTTLYCFIDAISQGILIYRCWVMWSGKAWLAIIPSILVFVSFTTSMTLVIELGTGRAHPETYVYPAWFFQVGVASFSVSLAVNALVTGLLVLKLILIHRELTRTAVGPTRDLRPLISFLVESGMFTFVGQLIWVVLFKLQDTGRNSMDSTVTILYGITPTIVIVRVAMGASYENNTMKAPIHSGLVFDNGRTTSTFGAAISQRIHNTVIQETKEDLEKTQVS